MPLTGAALLLFGSIGRPILAEDSEQTLYRQIDQKIANGEIDVGIEEARQALKKYPDSPQLHQVLGMAFYRKGLKSEAAEAFRKAVALDPSVSANYFNLGLVELSMRDARATGDLETFVRLAPDNAEGHLVLGQAYHYTNRTLLAVQQYKKALELSLELPLGHYHLGLAYQSQGNLKGALEEFENEIEVNPKFVEPYWLAGNIELRQEHFDAAQALFQRGIALKPEVFPAHYGLGQVFLAKGRIQEAESELRKCVELNPKEIEAHYALARAYQQLGKKKDAEHEYRIVAVLHAQRHAHLSSGITSRTPDRHGATQNINK